MKSFIGFICVVLVFAMVACKTADDANEKIDDCIAEEYGTDATDEMRTSLELTCEEGEQACDDCIDCVMDAQCEDLFDGECRSSCE